MIRSRSIKISQFNITKLTQILFYTFPISFILGNLIVSIWTLIFILASFLLIKKENLKYRFNNINWLLIIFFLYFFFLTLFQFGNYEVWINSAREAYSHLPPEENLMPIWQKKNLTLENHPIFKSLILIRFVFLIIVIDTLFFNKILNVKKFFLVCFISTSFLSLDIIFQYIFGFNFLGLKNLGRWHSGMFGNELIAGSYLQKFSFISFFYLIISYFKRKVINKKIIIPVIVVHLLAVGLAGNRMPFLLFIFGLILIILLFKNLRIIMVYSLIIFSIIFLIICKKTPEIGNAYYSFFAQSNIFNLASDRFKDKPKTADEKIKLKDDNKYKMGPKGIYANFLKTTGHGRIYLTSIEMWEEQHIFGFGLKSFRVKCWEILPRIKGLSCANHPHNYYLELLSEGGMVGFGIFIIFLIILCKDYLKFFAIKNQKTLFLTPFIIILFLEIWPLRSSGSFFTNWGATIFWLNISILISNKKN